MFAKVFGDKGSMGYARSQNYSLGFGRSKKEFWAVKSVTNIFYVQIFANEQILFVSYSYQFWGFGF